MQVRTLILTAIATGTLHSVSALADVKLIEIKEDPQVAAPVIEVSGPHRDAYTEVLTKTMNFHLVARGDAPGSSADGAHRFIIETVEHHKTVKKYEGELHEAWKKYKIPVKYSDISKPFGEHLSPIRRCNRQLKKASGTARDDFLFKGDTISLDDGFMFLARKTTPDHATRATAAPVTIRCMALDRNPQRATIRIEPAKVKQIGQHLCPMELKLYGRVESREKFAGKAVFVGPRYLSGFTALNFAQAGTRNVAGTYEPKWKPAGGFTTDPNAQPAKQKLTFYLHVSNNDSKLVRSAEETIEVSCKKITVAVPTIDNGLTIQPAN